MNTLIRTSIERPADLRQLIRKHQFFIKTTPINKHQKHMKQSLNIKTIPCQQRRSTAGRTLSLLVLFALGAFAVLPSPNAFGVSPPPDGGYPGGNTAEGQGALFSLTTGAYNTAVGFFSLRTNTDGSFNTAVGAGALLLNIGDQSTREGVENTAIGTAALLSNSTGSENTANGAFALFSNAGGGGNTATGDEALFTNTIGDNNTANGYEALYSNTTGSRNTANGALVAFSNTEGRSNTAMGVEALFNNTIGIENSAFGVDALTSNTTGSHNTAIGNSALYENTTSTSNTAVGDSALFLSTGQGNTALGAGAGTSVTTANNVIAIGHPGADVSDSCYIGNIFQAPVDPGSAVFVVIDSNGKLGTFASSKRFKEEIQPMDKASEELLALKPVTFRYKNYKNSPRQFGLIAEEVAEVNPDLVARDKNGEIYTVRYDQVNAMLLNEFLKEHKKVEEQESKIGKQQATIAELKSTVAEQQESFQSKLADQEKQIEALASGLQTVSAQVEMSSSPPRVVATNP
jgi:uncharacterized coiled-coil protein SlyX